jgi:hypothetical protein
MDYTVTLTAEEAQTANVSALTRMGQCADRISSTKGITDSGYKKYWQAMYDRANALHEKLHQAEMDAIRSTTKEIV